MFIGVRELDEFSSDLRRTNAAPTPGNFYKSCRYRGSKLLTKSQFSTRESELLITNEHGENISSEMIRNIGKRLHFSAKTFGQDPERSLACANWTNSLRIYVERMQRQLPVIFTNRVDVTDRSF